MPDSGLPLNASSSQTDCWIFCDAILPDVSRSFALIIPQCPHPIDQALCVAYLICRLADTVEDEPSINPNQRNVLYDALLRAVDEPNNHNKAKAFRDAWPTLPEGSYGQLIEGTCHIMSAFATLPNDFHPHIRTCVNDMIAGMRTIRPAEKRAGVSFLCRDLDDLDRYCHIVAGTVGIMSTALFEQRFAADAFKPTPQWREQGRRLGLGLQMTNIIKDCQSDADRSVSFIPACYVDFSHPSYRLSPPGRAELINHTVHHLDEAMAYVCAVPAGETGIRTFLLGSMLPAIATLEVAAPGTQAQPKINRDTMAEIFTIIDQHNADNDNLTAWYEQNRRRTLALLDNHAV